jgi:hypothetical protein
MSSMAGGGSEGLTSVGGHVGCGMLLLSSIMWFQRLCVTVCS